MPSPTLKNLIKYNSRYVTKKQYVWACELIIYQLGLDGKGNFSEYVRKALLEIFVAKHDPYITESYPTIISSIASAALKVGF